MSEYKRELLGLGGLCSTECHSNFWMHFFIPVRLSMQALSAGMQNRSPKPGPTAQDLELGYFLETGLQRAHVIHFKNGWERETAGDGRIDTGEKGKRELLVSQKSF